MSNGNNPAYPVAEDHKIADEFSWTAGLTKREYFAAMAMQGIIAADNPASLTTDQIADAAEQHADALLARLEE